MVSSKKARIEVKTESSSSVDDLLDRISNLTFCEAQMKDENFRTITQPLRSARFSELSSEEYSRLDERVIKRFCNNIKSNKFQLYTHQAEAISAIYAGESICISTSTSSGKSLAFNLPVLSDILNP